MDTTGKFLQKDLYISVICAAVFFCEPSLFSVLKSRSYILSSV